MALKIYIKKQHSILTTKKHYRKTITKKQHPSIKYSSYVNPLSLTCATIHSHVKQWKAK